VGTVPLQWALLGLAGVTALFLLVVVTGGVACLIFMRTMRKESESQRAYTERLVAIASSEKAASRYPIRSAAGDLPGEPIPPKVITEEEQAIKEMTEAGYDPTSMEDRAEWIEHSQLAN